MPDEIRQQLQYFNKVLTLFIIILVIMSVIIASLIVLKIQEIGTVNSLDKTIRDTLEKYKPDRDAQQKAREAIFNNTGILEENNLLLEQQNHLLMNLTTILKK